MKIAPMEVTYVDHMGTDLSVVNAARVSFDKISDELVEKDSKLIKYLADHNHYTTFTHCFITLRIKIPIFVARQLGKHQVGLTLNEVSRRYVSDEPEFYLPTVWRSKPEGSIKQGSGDAHYNNNGCNMVIKQNTLNGLMNYLAMIDEGVAPEQARMLLPQNTMTEWMWSGSLAAFARVCKLRLELHAQQETTEVARMIANVIAPLYPISWAALVGDHHG